MDMRLGVGLEEDDAADLEQIPIFEALIDLAPGDGAVSSASANTRQARNWVVQRNARDIKVDRLMLPACKDMHGGGVDFLHHTQTPALHF